MRLEAGMPAALPHKDQPSDCQPKQQKHLHAVEPTGEQDQIVTPPAIPIHLAVEDVISDHVEDHLPGPARKIHQQRAKPHEFTRREGGGVLGASL